MTRHFSIGQRVIARNYTGNSKWVPGIVRAQLGPLSYEVETGPNTDQLKDSNAPVTDNHTPVFHPMPFPALIENHGDQVPEPTEQTEAVSRETDGQSSNPEAESSVSCPPSQIEHAPVKR